MAVLTTNAMYGLFMVVVHALLLGEASRSPSSMHRPRAEQRFLREGSEGGEQGRYAWLLQLVDLDISWGHELFGFDESSCLVGGLLYGIVALLLCLAMLQVVHVGKTVLATASRWFLVFLNAEIILSVGLVYAKLENLCEMQEQHWPAFSMNCDALKFTYLQRSALMIMAALLCSWVFSSFTYVLTFGNTANVDKPEFAENLEVQGTARAALPQHAAQVAPLAPTSMYSARLPPPTRAASYTGQRSLAPSISDRTPVPHPGRYSALRTPSQQSVCVATPQRSVRPHARIGGA